MDNVTLLELLRLIAECSGDEAIEIVSRFQAGAMTIEGISVEEITDNH